MGQICVGEILAEKVICSVCNIETNIEEKVVSVTFL